MFSVTPEPAVTKPAYDPQARQARADQPPSDDFAALVDSNAAAASETDRPARPAPDAPRRDTRGTDAPRTDRPQADASTASSNSKASANKESGTAKQDAQSSAPADAAGNTSTDKSKSASGDTKTEDKPQDGNGEGDTAVAAVTPVIPAIVTDPVAVVIAAAAAPVATGNATESATTAAATAAIASASAVTTPVDASAAQTPDVAETNTTGATVTTGATTPTVETTAPEAAAATISAAATVIKSDSGKTEILAKDGEAAPAKDSKQPADPSAKPVSDQAIKPEAGAANTDDKPAQQDKATSATADTESSKHAGKAAPQAEHQAAAPTPQQTLTDPVLLPPTGIQPQPIQTHAANLTAIPVPTANTALADSAPVPLNGLAADIALRAAGGNSRFEIRLDPAELGRIDVRLDVDKHGNVTSHLTVERPATLDMLRRDAPQLQQALEDAGLKTGDSGLQFSLRDQSSSGRDSDNGSGRNSQRVVITEEDTVPAQVAGRTYGRMLGASSGVDIRI